MKKTIILVFTMISACLSADNIKLPDFPNGERLLGVEEPSWNTRRAAPIGKEVVVETDDPTAVVTRCNVGPRKLADRKASVMEDQVGYLNPRGTLFLGMDEKGKGIWFKNGGIVGAWSDSIHHWTFKQVVTGTYDSIRYTNKALDKYPTAFEEENYFYTDNKGNWCDSLVAAGGFQSAYMMDLYGDDDRYAWPSDMPLQKVYRRDTTERFMLLSKSASPTTSDAGFIVGGLPSANSSDGLWPLTNAVNISREGVSISYLSTEDLDGYTHYIYGTDSLNLDTIEDMSGTHYVRVAPKKIVTLYDKPQAPLYIKSISVLLGAKGNSSIRDNIRIHQLRVNVIDADSNIIATSTATIADTIKVSYSPVDKKARLLTFNFTTKSDYGETLSEGFLVSNAFMVEITDISSTDVFGIYSAKSTVHFSQSFIEYEDGTVAGHDYDPYIMLNGIYNTLENYVMTEAVRNFVDVENDGDTIPINMVSVSSPYYKYRAHYAAEDLSSGATFEYYSTFMPYDSVSRYWLMDVTKPAYIELGCDFDTNYGTDDNPVTLWNYIRAFDLYIYATSTPRIGDIISIGKCGRQAVFRIRAIDGATALSEATEQERNANVRKLMDQNGNVVIMKGNQQYNLIGQPIYY